MLDLVTGQYEWIIQERIEKKSSKYTECDSSSSSSSSSDDGDEEEKESTMRAADLLSANLSSSAGCVSVTALAFMSFIVTVFFAY
jgi:hypothetical protein